MSKGKTLLTFMQEGEILLDHWEQWDDGRLHALAAQDVAVLGHVPGRVEDILQVPEQLFVLAGQFLPGAPQASHGCQVQAATGRKKEARGGRDKWVVRWEEARGGTEVEMSRHKRRKEHIFSVRYIHPNQISILTLA